MKTASGSTFRCPPGHATTTPEHLPPFGARSAGGWFLAALFAAVALTGLAVYYLMLGASVLADLLIARGLLAPTIARPFAAFVDVNLVLALITVYGMVATYAQRKVASFIQCRLGPMEVGPGFAVKLRGRELLPPGWYGIGVVLADPIKLLSKEDTIPDKADKLLFCAAPYIVFAASLAAFAVIPYGPGLAPARLDGGLLFLLAVSTLGILGIVMGGYASNNKWSLYGAMRSVAQVVSYEIPMGLALLAVVLTAGSLDLVEIAEAQSGWFWNWYAFKNPWLFIAAIVYFIAGLAETNRTPFDLPEAESELVAGYHTEYSGMRFSIFYLAEYANMFLVSLVAATVFFGGYHTGIPIVDRLPLVGPLAIFAKAIIGVFIMIWIRWTIPRFRVDQLMMLCWKALFPVALIALLGSGIAIIQDQPLFEYFWRIMILVAIWLFVREVRDVNPKEEGSRGGGL